MADRIKHKGIVEKIDGFHLQVKIVQTSACSSCSIKGHCQASESKEKFIDVFDSNAASYHVGEQVYLFGSTSMGMRAVILAFGIPFLIVMSALILSLSITGDELVSAFISLASLIPYYVVLYFTRDRMRKNFVFTIEHMV